MTITGAIVIFAVLWFLVLFIVLPIGERSQSEDGHVVPGTPASAPVDPMMRKKLKWTTAITIVLWILIVWVIMSGVLTVKDFDIFNRMDSPE